MSDPRPLVCPIEVGDTAMERGLKLVRPTIPTPGGRAGMAMWRPVGGDGDSVEVIWTSGYAGVGLELGPTARGLEGTATAFTDVVSAEWPSARANAVRTACPP